MSSVLASGALFLLRGLLIQLGRSQWALAAPVRFASYTIDSLLLLAGLLLLGMLPAVAYANGWLAAKLLLLPVYIVLGWKALRVADTRVRLLYLAAAAIVYASMFTIARAHHPLGWIRLLIGD